MRIQGAHQLTTSRADLYRRLLSPEALRHCIPGCQRMEIVEPNVYEATMTVNTRVLRGVYTGTIRLSDVEPETRFRIIVDGGGPGGSVHGDGVITLADGEESGAILTFVGDLRLPGLLNLLGERMVAPVVHELSGRFFRCLESVDL